MTQSVGAKSRYPVIFLHGYSGEASSLKEFARYHSGEDAICITLPGFGGSVSPSRAAIEDFDLYCDTVWRQIREIVPEGKVALVGHSYGAMVTFNVACRHKSGVASVDLYCPVASPRFIPRSAMGLVRMASVLKFPMTLIIRLFSWSAVVDAATRFMLRKDWPADVRQRIISMRRGEVRFYSVVMFQIMGQSSRFRSTMRNARCAVPMRICATGDDTVAGKRDSEWYVAHADTSSVVETYGGHLCVVAEPERLAHIFDAA